MEVDNQRNQSYWVEVRQERDSVIFRSNSCDTQNHPIAEQKASHIKNTSDDRKYIQLNNIQPTTEDITTEAIAAEAFATEVIGTEVTGTDVLGVEVIRAEVIGTEVIEAEVIGTELSGTDVLGTEVIEAEVIGTEVVATGVIGTEVNGAEDMETDEIEAEVIGTVVVGTEYTETEDIEIEEIEAEVIGTEVVGTEYIETEVIGTEDIETEETEADDNIGTEVVATGVIGTEDTETEDKEAEAIETEDSETEDSETEDTESEDIEVDVIGTEVTEATETETIATDASAAESNTKKTTKRLLINDENFWNRYKIKLLLTLCLDRRFKCPETDNILFDEISILIHTTPKECEKKYRYLRRTYISCLRRKNLGKEVKWIHFGTCDSIFKHCKTLTPLLLEPWEDSKNKQLLKLYVENLKKLRSNKKITQNEVWKNIATELDTTEYNCYHKFKSLKSTYFKWLQKTKESGRSIKWPYHHYFESIYTNYRRNLKVWDKNKIRSLINAYSEIAHKFKSPKYQKKDLWKEIGLKIGEDAKNCDRKFRNLKQTYIGLKRRLDSSAINWRYYKDFAAVFEKTPYTAIEDGEDRPLHQDGVHQMLSFCVRNKDKFKDPIGRKRMLWAQISTRLGLTPEQCAKKFRNMKRTYFKLLEKQRKTGKSSQWQYFSYFEQIYGIKTPKRNLEKYNADNLPLPEIRNLVKNLQSKDADNFDNLVKVIEISNNIQRERNQILQLLLDKM